MLNATSQKAPGRIHIEAFESSSLRAFQRPSVLADVSRSDSSSGSPSSSRGWPRRSVSALEQRSPRPARRAPKKEGGGALARRGGGGGDPLDPDLEERLGVRLGLGPACHRPVRDRALQHVHECRALGLEQPRTKLEGVHQVSQLTRHLQGTPPIWPVQDELEERRHHPSPPAGTLGGWQARRQRRSNPPSLPAFKRSSVLAYSPASVSRNRSASMAAIHPLPAAVTAWRYT